MEKVCCKVFQQNAHLTNITHTHRSKIVRVAAEERWSFEIIAEEIESIALRHKVL
jgi:hypothetical protein